MPALLFGGVWQRRETENTFLWRAWDETQNTTATGVRIRHQRSVSSAKPLLFTPATTSSNKPFVSPKHELFLTVYLCMAVDEHPHSNMQSFLQCYLNFPRMPLLQWYWNLSQRGFFCTLKNSHSKVSEEKKIILLETYSVFTHILHHSINIAMKCLKLCLQMMKEQK